MRSHERITSAGDEATFTFSPCSLTSSSDLATERFHLPQEGLGQLSVVASEPRLSDSRREGLVFESLMPHTQSERPPVVNRRRDMPSPIRPRPMNPMRVSVSDMCTLQTEEVVEGWSGRDLKSCDVTAHRNTTPWEKGRTVALNQQNPLEKNSSLISH